MRDEDVRQGALINALAYTMAVQELRDAAANYVTREKDRALIRARADVLEERRQQVIAAAVKRSRTAPGSRLNPGP